MTVYLKNWVLTDVATGEKVQARVPGDITKDLYDAGKIEDPYCNIDGKRSRKIRIHDKRFI